MKKAKHITNHGGKRSGAGRPLVSDKKNLIKIYVRKSKIEAIGSKEAVTSVCYLAIDQEVARQNESI